jgi:hypothetical protein
MKKATTTMKKTKSGGEEGKGGDSPSHLIDARIQELTDWRGETLARIRMLIQQADAEVVRRSSGVGRPAPGVGGVACSTFSFPISGEVRMLRCGGGGMKRGSILDRLVEPVVRTFTPEVARALVRLRADPELQARMDELAEKCNQGRMTPEEREEYDTSVRFANYLAIIQARARRLLRASERR